MKYGFIREQQAHYPVTLLCRVMEVGSSAYYGWHKSDKSVVISHGHWRLCQQMKALFRESKESLGSRQMMKQLRKEGFPIGRYRTRKLMARLKLAAKRKKRHMNTTDSKHQQPVADNLLDRQFTPAAPNQVWTTDITYIWTLQGWVYLAVVLGLHSRRVVGWSLGGPDGNGTRGACADDGDQPAQPNGRAAAPFRPGQPVRQPRMPATAQTEWHGVFHEP